MSEPTRAQWLDAIGIDRWVARDAPASTQVLTTETHQSAPDVESDVLTIVVDSLAAGDRVVLEKMLAAISVPLSRCAIVDSANGYLPDSPRPVLVLAAAGTEAIWSDHCAAFSGVAEVVAHPARFVDEPGLKRPAWEALKRLGAAISGA